MPNEINVVIKSKERKETAMRQANNHKHTLNVFRKSYLEEFIFIFIIYVRFHLDDARTTNQDLLLISETAPSCCV